MKRFLFLLLFVFAGCCHFNMGLYRKIPPEVQVSPLHKLSPADIINYLNILEKMSPYLFPENNRVDILYFEFKSEEK